MNWVHLMVLAAILQSVAPPVRFDRCLRSGEVRARWELPPQWREVSGLALGADGRIFLHGDETGRIGVLDAATGKLVGTFELGTTSPRGDFEDIAVVGDHLYLITGSGRLYEVSLPPKDRASGSLPYTVFDTKAGRWCAVEGLAFDPIDEVLLLGCKAMKADAGQAPAVLRWSLKEQRLASPQRVVLKGSTPFPMGSKDRLRPSAIAVDPNSDRWVVISSADSRVVVVNRRGAILASGSLPKRHRQPEGLAISATGEVYVSDEGGKGLGSVTVYGCR